MPNSRLRCFPPCTPISTQRQSCAGQTNWGPRSVQQEESNQKMQALYSSWLSCALELDPAVIRWSWCGSAFGTRFCAASNSHMATRTAKNRSLPPPVKTEGLWNLCHHSYKTIGMYVCMYIFIGRWALKFSPTMRSYQFVSYL